MNKHLLICEGQLAIDLPRRAARGAEVRAAAQPGEVSTFSANGYVFETEENMMEFVNEQLKKNPSLKFVKYSPTDQFFVDPGPVVRKKFDTEAGDFIGGV